MSTILSPKIPLKYVCETCHYTTCNKKDYNKHLLTDKHKKLKISTDFNKKSQEIPNHSVCECGKIYKERSGLWRHKQKCNVESIKEVDEKNTCKSEEEHPDKDLIMLLIKENSELKNMMMEVIKNGTNNTVNSNIVNSNNQAFNLNLFLNETCKDAMNIMDFVDSIKLQLSDLEKVGELGYVEGISSIIVNNLKQLDVTQRPVHCTDKKRETMYIKDEDKWEKEDEKNTKLKKVIRHVENKNIRYIKRYPKKELLLNHHYLSKKSLVNNFKMYLPYIKKGNYIELGCGSGMLVNFL